MTAQFLRRPFLLPCLIAAAVSLVALFNSAFVIKETLPSLAKARARRAAARPLTRIFTLSNMYDVHGRQRRPVTRGTVPYAVLDRSPVRVPPLRSLLPHARRPWPLNSQSPSGF